MEYARAKMENLDAVASLASLLWHEDDFDNIEDLKSQFAGIIDNENSAVFLCAEGREAVGFAQFSLRRDYVEGTRVRPVGYLEGIYVREQYRRRGVAGRLLRMGEAWALERGCAQLASDCELHNEGSLRFHLGIGFAEANRIICFVKDIGASRNNEMETRSGI